MDFKNILDQVKSKFPKTLLKKPSKLQAGSQSSKASKQSKPTEQKPISFKLSYSFKQLLGLLMIVIGLIFVGIAIMTW